MSASGGSSSLSNGDGKQRTDAAGGPLLNAGPRRVEYSTPRYTPQPSSTKIQALLARLIARLTSPALKDKTKEQKEAATDKWLQYALRLLTSRLHPQAFKDEPHLCNAIKKKLGVGDAKRRAIAQRNGTEAEDKAQEFEELYARLKALNIMKETWASLYVLYALSEESGTMSGKRPALPTHQFNGLVGVIPVHGAGGQDAEHGGDKALQVSKLQLAQQLEATKQTDMRSRIRKLIKENTVNEVSEEQLIRDVLFTFQGIDGQFIKYNVEHDAYTVIPEVGVSLPTRAFVGQICELGWMYRRIHGYVAQTLARPSVGLVEQSFCGAIQQELADYYRLIAVLETQLQQTLLTSALPPTLQSPENKQETGTPNENTPPAGAGESRFTLRRLYVWIQEPLQRLRLVAMLTDAAVGVKGGALASAIQSFLAHGDALVFHFVQKMMKQLCRPLFGMLQKWVYCGQLDDPFEEFFVAADPRVPNDRLWNDKYTLRHAMIPSFISLELANKILLIGKSINFVRQCCGDSDWVSEVTLVLATGGVEYTPGGIDGELEEAINEVSEVTNRRVKQIMLERFHLEAHCLALKKYMLLAQGDFIQHLMDLLHSELDKLATNMYEHAHMAVLKAAIRSSNAQFEDPDILARLQVTHHKSIDGDSGWEIFSLDYHTGTPINVVFTHEASRIYKQLFNFLWRMKRVEHSLAASWKNLMGTMAKRNTLPQLQKLLHRAHTLRSEMQHFIHNLHNYMMFEVMECAWKDLLEDMHKATNLDELIKAHSSYLQQILDKALMGQSDKSLYQHLVKLFDTTLKFCKLVEALSGDCGRELQRRAAVAQQIASRSERQEWGLEGASERQHEQLLQLAPTEIVSKYQPSLEKLDDEYHRRFMVFLGELRRPSTELRFLRLRLDFNQFYAEPDKKKEELRQQNAQAHLAAMERERLRAAQAKAGPGLSAEDKATQLLMTNTPPS